MGRWNYSRNNCVMTFDEREAAFNAGEAKAGKLAGIPCVGTAEKPEGRGGYRSWFSGGLTVGECSSQISAFAQTLLCARRGIPLVQTHDGEWEGKEWKSEYRAWNTAELVKHYEGMLSEDCRLEALRDSYNLPLAEKEEKSREAFSAEFGETAGKIGAAYWNSVTEKWEPYIPLKRAKQIAARPKRHDMDVIKAAQSTIDTAAQRKAVADSGLATFAEFQEAEAAYVQCVKENIPVAHCTPELAAQIDPTGAIRRGGLMRSDIRAAQVA